MQSQQPSLLMQLVKEGSTRRNDGSFHQHMFQAKGNGGHTFSHTYRSLRNA